MLKIKEFIQALYKDKEYNANKNGYIQENGILVIESEEKAIC